MEQFFALAVGDAAPWRREILSCTVLEHLSLAVQAAGGRLWLASQTTQGDEITTDDFWREAQGSKALLLFFPAAALSGETLSRLVNQAEIACLVAGRTPVALFGDAAALRDLNMGQLPQDLPQVQAAPAEAIPVTDAESAYAAQEQLRRRINMGWIRKGVMLVDPNTTHISPRARLEPGCTILPGCLLYGETRVGAGSVIGPNALLRDAVIGEGCTVNASQINQSTVGDRTTVGPFAYIRPGCDVGAGARIGDFVELKNSSVGEGTKISHLTYIGDSDLGRHINVGCGVVTVNYDGKRKHRTRVEDGSFIGCNVNLVSPVKVGRGAYLAAGGTITKDVPEDALVVARSRETVKEDWAARRREEGLL